MNYKNHIQCVMFSRRTNQHISNVCCRLQCLKTINTIHAVSFKKKSSFLDTLATKTYLCSLFTSKYLFYISNLFTYFIRQIKDTSFIGKKRFSTMLIYTVPCISLERAIVMVSVRVSIIDKSNVKYHLSERLDTYILG